MIEKCAKSRNDKSIRCVKIVKTKVIKEMKKKKNSKLKYTKETQKGRKMRVSSGVKFRGVVFEDKRRKLRDKIDKNEKANYDV